MSNGEHLSYFSHIFFFFSNGGVSRPPRVLFISIWNDDIHHEQSPVRDSQFLPLFLLFVLKLFMRRCGVLKSEIKKGGTLPL